MDIFVLLLISILVYLLPLSNDYLGVESTTGLKGFLALGIVFHHLSQWVTTGMEFSNFGYMGTYIVSVFFFLSGYGLYVQNEKKENYLDNFLVKRLSKILTPFIIISSIYLIYRSINGQVLSSSFFIDLFKKGSTVIYNGWFVDIIILMYIFFYISFRVFTNKTIAILVNTLFIISLAVIQSTGTIALLHSTWVLLVITIMSSYLLNANLPLFALKFKDYSFKNNAVKYIFLAISVLLIAILKVIAVPIIILLYILLSLITKR